MTWYKVSELDGDLLDRAVQKALLPIAMRAPREMWREGYEPPPARPYSVSWDCAGPIIERERITLIAPDERPDQLGASARLLWTAAKYVVDDDEDEEEFEQEGTTPLVAAMRAFVAHKFGDEVDL